MDTVDELRRACGFTSTHWVEGRESIADLFLIGERCGVYLLHFSSREYYIGQVVDVVRRFSQHRKQHSDIQQVSFCHLRLEGLNEAERSAIQTFEQSGIPLRNITFMSAPIVEADFDLVMTQAQQEAWLADPEKVDFGRSRPVNAEQRRRYRRKFEQFQGLRDAADVLQVLRNYAQRCIPVLRSSEMSFWCCSCMPGNPGKNKVYSRINLAWQEVFTVHEDTDLYFSWHVALSPIEQMYGKRLWRFRLRFPFVRIERSHTYVSGGADQINLWTVGIENALRLQRNSVFLQAARLFNLRLMRKGACIFSRYHCLDLADQLMPP